MSTRRWNSTRARTWLESLRGWCAARANGTAPPKPAPQRNARPTDLPETSIRVDANDVVGRESLGHYRLVEIESALDGLLVVGGVFGAIYGAVIGTDVLGLVGAFLGLATYGVFGVVVGACAIGLGARALVRIPVDFEVLQRAGITPRGLESSASRWWFRKWSFYEGVVLLVTIGSPVVLLSGAAIVLGAVLL